MAKLYVFILLEHDKETHLIQDLPQYVLLCSDMIAIIIFKQYDIEYLNEYGIWRSREGDRGEWGEGSIHK